MAPPLNDNQKKLLHYLVYDKHMYFGRDKLKAYVDAHYPEFDISRRQIMEWLNNNELSQLFKPTRKTNEIQPTILSRPFQQLAIDLADMQHYATNGYNYILTVIDLFSKKAWTKPLKNKKDTTVVTAMRSILKTIKEPVTTIRSDNGSEFIAKTFKNLLKKHGIKQVLSDAGKPQSNGGIERFNATIKRMIKMYITQTDKSDWHKVLPTLVENYNETKHRITNMVPNTLSSNKVGKLNLSVKDRIKKLVQPKNDKSQSDPILKKGDSVRIKQMKKGDHDKQTVNWSKALFTVYKVHKPRKKFSRAYYFVEDDENRYTSKLYNNDLQLVKHINNPVEEPDKIVISKIVKKVKKGTKTHYWVKWLNEKALTLEPEEGLMRDVPKMVKNFNKK
jgi:transposase InsO family protein